MDKITWIDVETTNLSPHDGGKLLQIACLVTDNDLNILDEEGYEAIVSYTAEEVVVLLEGTNEYVTAMHTRTGLWDRLSSPEGKSLETIDQEILEYVKQFQPEPRKAWFGGNSIKLDRDYSEFYLPNLYEHIHYRSVDVTSFAGVIQSDYGYTFKKNSTHDAMDDIRESIAELKEYRKLFFKKRSGFAMFFSKLKLAITHSFK